MAPRTSKAASLINGRRLRATRLDGCGRPVYGDDSVAVSKGFVTVAYTANTSSGNDVSVTNANGDICVSQPAKTQLLGYGIEIDFCAVDPAVLSLFTGQPVVLNAAGDSIVGFNVDTKIDLTDSGVALEVWAGANDSDACATEGGQGSFGYILLPFIQGGYLGDFTVQNGAIDFTVSGANTVDGNGWGRGPYNVVLDADDDPAPLNEALTTTNALHFEFTGIAPPDAIDGLRPLLDPTTEAYTALTATVATGSHTAVFSVTPADIVGPAYYDFGDGTWDYIASGSLGATSHTYPTITGTQHYTVKATSNGTDYVTTTVTVPGT